MIFVSVAKFAAVAGEHNEIRIRTIENLVVRDLVLMHDSLLTIYRSTIREFDLKFTCWAAPRLYKTKINKMLPFEPRR